MEKYGTREISLHVASSMIHELTPFIKALSATQRIDWLYCDEVENSLHPLLQREMARWLIRMVNAGMHIINRKKNRLFCQSARNSLDSLEITWL